MFKKPQVISDDIRSDSLHDPVSPIFLGNRSMTEFLTVSEPSELESLLNDRLPEKFRVRIATEKQNPWPEDEGLFMPYFDLMIGAPEDEESTDRVVKCVGRMFDVASVLKEAGQLRLLCYGDDGPAVESIDSVLLVIHVIFGPHITKCMDSLGIDDYRIMFQIDTLYM